MCDIVNNVRVRGYTIDTLNTMLYENLDNADGDEFEHHSVPCNYVLPKQYKVPIDKMSILTFNVRSMYSNFDNFKCELLH